MGENDAWQAAVAECMRSRVLAHDQGFAWLGAAYETIVSAEPRCDRPLCGASEASARASDFHWLGGTGSNQWPLPC